jgi:hypothetical protein
LLLALLRVWITRSRERATANAQTFELALENQP